MEGEGRREERVGRFEGERDKHMYVCLYNELTLCVDFDPKLFTNSFLCIEVSP